MSTMVFGHKNPDTDTVMSSIALAELKTQMGFDAKAFVLGSINKESKYALEYFNVQCPDYLKNVYIQILDIDFDKMKGVDGNSSILWCYKLMEANNLKTLAITKGEALVGIITMKDIAMSLIRGDFYKTNTSINNIIDGLGGQIITSYESTISGNILVLAYNFETLMGKIDESSIVIVGDRYDVIEYAILHRVRLIIITGGLKLPEGLIDLANETKVNIISVATDTYITAKLINQCNYVSSIMKTEKILKFNINRYLKDIREEMVSTSYRNYPIVDDNNNFLGFIHRRHILNPSKKKVILVDHNEYSQSAEGLNEAEIIEIVDHHKLGDISTNIPITFTNIPVGSACTIVYKMFRENNINISGKIAGIILSGVISDTIMFKSPTTTPTDREVVKELVKFLNLDITTFALNMFKTGTSLEDRTVEEIFNRDFKEFNMENLRIGISQVYTLDFESILKRKRQFTTYINKIHAQNKFFLTLFLVTDILKEGSYLFFKTNNNSLISLAFNTESVQGVFADGIVSRKKQVIPQIMNALNLIK